MNDEKIDDLVGPLLWRQLVPLFPGDADRQREFKKFVARVIDAYPADQLLQELASHPKVEKAKLAMLVKRLDQTLAAIFELAPHYAVAIADLGARGAKKEMIDLPRLETDLALLKLGAMRFVSALEPTKGKPPNFALEEAVRTLMRLFQDELGLSIGIRWNKPNGGAAEASTEGTRVIVAILKRVPNPPTETAIFNMIRRVKEDPDGESRSPLDDAMRAHFDELDASLLSGRD